MKSNVRPRTKTRIRTTSSTLGVSSSMLERDVAENRGDFFGLVGGVLEELINVVPAHRLDQLGDLVDTVVQRRDCLGEEIVGLVLEPMDLLGGALQRVGAPTLLEQRHALRDQLGLLKDDFRELKRYLRRLIDSVQTHATRDLFDPVDHIVERRREMAD